MKGRPRDANPGMDLFDPASLTAEQRFMLAMQERLDALTDQVNGLAAEVRGLRSDVSKVRGPPDGDPRLVCRDLGRQAAAAFVRVELTAAGSVESLTRCLQETAEVHDYGHFASAVTPAGFCYGVVDRLQPTTTQIVQAVVGFGRTMAVGNLGAAVLDRMPRGSVAAVHVCAISNACVGARSDDDPLYSWYFVHIGAGQLGTAVDALMDGDVQWWYRGEGVRPRILMANIPGLETVDDLLARAEAAHGVPGDLVWPLLSRAERQ